MEGTGSPQMENTELNSETKYEGTPKTLIFQYSSDVLDRVGGGLA